MYDATRLRRMIDELRHIERLIASEDPDDQQAGRAWFEQSFHDPAHLAFIEYTAADDGDAYMQSLAQEALDLYDQSPGGELRRRRIARLAEADVMRERLERIIRDLNEVMRFLKGPNASYQQRGNALFQTKFADGQRQALVQEVLDDGNYPESVMVLARQAQALFDAAPPIVDRRDMVAADADDEAYYQRLLLLPEPQTRGRLPWWVTLGLMVAVVVLVLIGADQLGVVLPLPGNP